MNKNVLKIGLFSLVFLGFTSCNKKENELADKRISELESYVDSLKTVSDEDMKNNWDKISEDYETRTANANEALANLDEESKSKSQIRITTTTTNYDLFKKNIETKPVVIASPSQLLRDRLFGAGKIGEDMSFAWVNKDNILAVYDTFFQSYKDNKGDFSREDYDEVKLMYEALDSRKNTVEKEGLSNDDNMKIASIKFKFAPMFKMNRIGAKSRETAEAKE